MAGTLQEDRARLLYMLGSADLNFLVAAEKRIATAAETLNCSNAKSNEKLCKEKAVVSTLWHYGVLVKSMVKVAASARHVRPAPQQPPLVGLALELGPNRALAKAGFGGGHRV